MDIEKTWTDPREVRIEANPCNGANTLTVSSHFFLSRMHKITIFFLVSLFLNLLFASIIVLNSMLSRLSAILYLRCERRLCRNYDPTSDWFVRKNSSKKWTDVVYLCYKVRCALPSTEKQLVWEWYDSRDMKKFDRLLDELLSKKIYSKFIKIKIFRHQNKIITS